MIAVRLHDLIPVAVEHGLDSLVGGLILAAVAWIWLRLAKGQNSASRFLILLLSLIGIAVLPFAGISWVPSGNVGSGATANTSLLTLPQGTAGYFLAAWAIVATVLLVRIGIGLLQLRRLKQSCVALAADTLNPNIRAALLSTSRPVELCVSDRINVPTALGLGRSAKIAIPSWLIDQLSPEELHHIVLHEVAHLRRWDDWTNLLQRILTAVLFFHPAVWWLQSQMSLEREMACDEHVLAETGDPRAYAKSLTAIAERNFVRRTVAMAQAAVSRLHHTTLRVARILSSTPPCHRRSVIPVFTSVTVISGLTMAVALHSPNLVNFADRSPLNIGKIATSANQAAEISPKAIAASLSTPDSPRDIRSDNREPARESRQPAKRLKTSEALVAKKQAPMRDHPRELAEIQKSQHPMFVPANGAATAEEGSVVSHPAVLVVWQETVNSNGVVTIQQSYWRVVVYENVAPKERQPKRT